MAILYFPFPLMRSLFNLAEVADGDPLFASRRSCAFAAVPTIRSDGGNRWRSFRISSAAGKAPEGGAERTAQPSDRNPEAIISLFKQIRASISKDDSESSKKRNAKVSEGKMTSQGDKRLTRRGGRVRVEQKDDSPSTKSSSSRPPSSFMKRSPIPSPSPPRETTDEFKSEASPPVANKENELVSQEIRDMKLPELKELAKRRGIKGYSKLKKNELIELLIKS